MSTFARRQAGNRKHVQFYHICCWQYDRITAKAVILRCVIIGIVGCMVGQIVDGSGCGVVDSSTCNISDGMRDFGWTVLNR